MHMFINPIFSRPGEVSKAPLERVVTAPSVRRLLSLLAYFAAIFKFFLQVLCRIFTRRPRGIRRYSFFKFIFLRAPVGVGVVPVCVSADECIHFFIIIDFFKLTYKYALKYIDKKTLFYLCMIQWKIHSIMWIDKKNNLIIYHTKNNAFNVLHSCDTV